MAPVLGVGTTETLADATEWEAALHEQVRRPLEESRAEADRILAFAARRAREIGPDEEVAEATRRRLQGLVDLCAEIDDRADQLERSYAAAADAMWVRARELLALTEEAEFQRPEWAFAARSISAIRLSETRELTIRFGSRENRAGGSGKERIGVEEGAV